MATQVTFLAVAVVLLGSIEAIPFHKLSNAGEIKAVLVAGSNSYYNYRHQADICHAYQILHENGIPDENIIVMMFDDIANSTENPDKGVIINRPGGPNVYKNVPKDYVGKDVNKKNFFNVLSGNRDAMNGIGSGRVLESGPNDHVFVNFVDHGGPGVLLMPNEEIKASEMIEVLENMSKSSQFEKMFLYIEACESGSIFENLLPDDLNIFVMTAADPHESSYACFYDQRLQTYLGDVYSVKWMQDAETVDLRSESVNHQFQKVRSETNTSHVEEYGDIDIGNTKLSQVIGYREKLIHSYPLDFTDAVSAHHIPVAIIKQRIESTKDTQDREHLTRELRQVMKGRDKIKRFFVQLVLDVIQPAITISTLNVKNALVKQSALTKANLGCYENALSHLAKECFSISENPFVASQLHTLINLCDMMPETSVVEKIKSLCHGRPKPRGII